MSMLVSLTMNLGVELFDLAETIQAESIAKATNGQIYCWKTIGKSNWLERGVSITDVLGLVVLPQGLPDVIEMLDDTEEPDAD